VAPDLASRSPSAASANEVVAKSRPRVVTHPVRERKLEVVLSESESRAIRDLIAGVSAGRIDLSSLPVEDSHVTDIVVPPITVDPIVIDRVREGVRQ
jgi:hypothetical protein